MENFANMIRIIENNLNKLHENVTDVKNRKPLLGSASSGSVVETEIIFKEYIKNGFSEGISLRSYYLVLNHFSLTHPVEDILIDDNYNSLDNRFTTINGITTIMRKDRISDNKDNFYNLRYTLALENPLSKREAGPTEIVKSRLKQRKMIQLAPGISLHLTKIVGEPTVYELELEFDHKLLADKAKKFLLINKIIEIYQVMHDTHLPYITKEYTNVVNFFNTTLKTKFDLKDPYSMGKGVLFQARNLRSTDLTGGELRSGRENDGTVVKHPETQLLKTGGIVNSYIDGRYINYTITVKADGERKILVIDSTGLWLLMSPGQANLVSRDINPHTIGLILEVEYIPTTERNEDYGQFDEVAKYEYFPQFTFFYDKIHLTTKYLMLIYDCLATPQQKSDVQVLRHKDRLEAAAGYVGAYQKNEIFVLTMKNFYGFNTADELFERVTYLEENKTEMLPYKDDGYIITADNMAYNESKKYVSFQEAQETWIKETSEGPWLNSYGDEIRLEGDKLVEYSTDDNFQITTDGKLKITTDDGVWYTNQLLTYTLIDGIWTVVGEQTENEKVDRLWSPFNPNNWKNKVLAFGQPEIKNKLVVEGDYIYQDLTLRDNRTKRISNIPLNARRLQYIPDICKLKPFDKLTIDFQINRDNNGLVVLYSKGYDNELVEFKGSDKYSFNGQVAEVEVEDGSIIEFAWDYQKEIMVPHKVRLDKNDPNLHVFAKNIWNDINDQIDIDPKTGQKIVVSLIDTLSGKTNKLMRGYHNRIKKRLFTDAIKHIKKNSEQSQYNLLDIGTGRGGDIYKWGNVKRVLAVEPDRRNIEGSGGLLDRLQKKYGTEIMIIDEQDEDWQDKIDFAIDNEHVVIILATVGQNTELISKIVAAWLGQADLIALMLSMSFFWSSQADVKSLAQTIKNNLAPQGLVTFFTIDGPRVRNLFSNVEQAVPHRPCVRENFDTMMINDRNQACLNDYNSPSDRLQHSLRGEDDRLEIKLENIGTSLTYFEDLNQLDITIPGTIVGDQTEWLVDLKDLGSYLPEYVINVYVQADRELFLNDNERVLSSLYVGGQIVTKTNEINDITERLLKNVSVSKPSPFAVKTKQPIKPLVKAKNEEPLVKAKNEEPVITEKDEGDIRVESPRLQRRPAPIVLAESISPIIKKRSQLEILDPDYSMIIDKDVVKNLVKNLVENLVKNLVKNLVRIGTVRKDNNFLDAVLLAFNEEYASSPSPRQREKIVNDILQLIPELNDNNNVANLLKVNIFVYIYEEGDLISDIQYNSDKSDKDPVINLLRLDDHYELLALDTNGLLQTVFEYNESIFR